MARYNKIAGYEHWCETDWGISTAENKKEEKNMAQINKDTMIGELLQIDEKIAPILLNIGMHCLGCPSSQMETIAEAAMVHGIDPDDLVVEIYTFLDSDRGY